MYADYLKVALPQLVGPAPPLAALIGGPAPPLAALIVPHPPVSITEKRGPKFACE